MYHTLAKESTDSHGNYRRVPHMTLLPMKAEPRLKIMLRQFAQAFVSLAYQMPVILTSFGAFAPRSVSEGWIDWKTPAISPVAGSTFAADRAMKPLSAAVFFEFSLASSASSPRAGRATAVS